MTLPPLPLLSHQVLPDAFAPARLLAALRHRPFGALTGGARSLVVIVVAGVVPSVLLMLLVTSLA